MSWMASCPEFSLPILEIRRLTGVCFVGGTEKKSHPHEGGSKLQCHQEPLCPPPHLCVFHSLCLEGSSSTESSRQTPLMHQEPLPSIGTIPCISSTGFRANCSYGSHWCRWKGCHSDMHGVQSPCKVSFFHLLHKMLKSQRLQGMCTKNLQPGSKLHLQEADWSSSLLPPCGPWAGWPQKRGLLLRLAGLLQIASPVTVLDPGEENLGN